MAIMIVYKLTWMHSVNSQQFIDSPHYLWVKKLDLTRNLTGTWHLVKLLKDSFGSTKFRHDFLQ